MVLKKEFRGLNRSDFEEILAGGRSYNTPLFMAKWLFVEDGFKVGLIISRKVSKSAVIRNSIKRKLMNGIEGSWDYWSKTGVKLVLLVKKQMIEAKNSEVNLELDKVNEKISSEITGNI